MGTEPLILAMEKGMIMQGNKIKHLLVPAITSILLAGFSVSAISAEEPTTTEKKTLKLKFNPTDDQIEKAKQNVASKLKDPESARFSDFYGVKTFDVDADGNTIGSVHIFICGNVNAKNSYGGYVGQTLFGANIEKDGALLMVNNPTKMDLVMNDALRTACSYTGEEDI